MPKRGIRERESKKRDAYPDVARSQAREQQPEVVQQVTRRLPARAFDDFEELRSFRRRRARHLAGRCGGLAGGKAACRRRRSQCPQLLEDLGRRGRDSAPACCAAVRRRRRHRQEPRQLLQQPCP